MHAPHHGYRETSQSNMRVSQPTMMRSSTRPSSSSRFFQSNISTGQYDMKEPFEGSKNYNGSNISRNVKLEHPKNMHREQAPPPPPRKRGTSIGQRGRGSAKERTFTPISGTKDVFIHCCHGCGITYRTPALLVTTNSRNTYRPPESSADKKEWHKVIRRLNAHEAQRCSQRNRNKRQCTTTPDARTQINKASNKTKNAFPVDTRLLFEAERLRQQRIFDVDYRLPPSDVRLKRRRASTAFTSSLEAREREWRINAINTNIAGKIEANNSPIKTVVHTTESDFCPQRMYVFISNFKTTFHTKFCT